MSPVFDSYGCSDKNFAKITTWNSLERNFIIVYWFSISSSTVTVNGEELSPQQAVEQNIKENDTLSTLPINGVVAQFADDPRCDVGQALADGKCGKHLPLVPHKKSMNRVSIGSDNGLSPGRRQAIIWTNAGILLIGPSRTNFSEILIANLIFSSKKTYLKMSLAKWRLFWKYACRVHLELC